jgi:glycosyltransferase involved in cell wall biosynthesis
MFNKKTCKIALIIPTFNESKNIKKVLNNLNNKYKIIIINDGSNDDTNFQALRNKNTVLLNHKYNLGYDSALLTGFKYAYKEKYDFAITFDADNQFYIKDLKKILNIIELSDYDIIIGERKKFQRLGESISGYFFNLLFDIKDPFCGLKAYRLKNVSKKKFLEFYKKKFYGLQFLKAYIKINNYKCIKIKTKPRIGNPKLKNSIFVNIKMIYATLFLLIVTLK